MIFFTSDEHFGHANVIKFCNRPFADLEEMREGLIERHNSVVGTGDLVYHLGDMFWRSCSPIEALTIMKCLNGQHFYIRGNHEELIDKVGPLRDRFVWVKERAKIHPAPLGKHPGIVLDHYAGRVWNGSHNGSWQLYGHSHGELSKSSYGMASGDGLLSFDVGVDCWDYYPVSLDQVKTAMESIEKTRRMPEAS